MGMKNEMSDAHLVRAYRSGDDSAFETLYRRYERPLFSFILRFVGNRESAEDLIQLIWMKVLKGLPGYRERDKFGSWLFGIANNCCIDHVRGNARKQIDDLVSSDKMDQIPDIDPEPEGGLMQNELNACLHLAIQELPDEQKQVVLLRLYSELPFKEIARIAGSSLNTVLGRMHYAVRNLRKTLQTTYGEDFSNVLS